MFLLWIVHIYTHVTNYLSKVWFNAQHLMHQTSHFTSTRNTSYVWVKFSSKIFIDIVKGVLRTFSTFHSITSRYLLDVFPLTQKKVSSRLDPSWSPSLKYFQLYSYPSFQIHYQVVTSTFSSQICLKMLSTCHTYRIIGHEMTILHIFLIDTSIMRTILYIERQWTNWISYTTIYDCFGSHNDLLSLHNIPRYLTPQNIPIIALEYISSIGYGGRLSLRQTAKPPCLTLLIEKVRS